jgi:hypothetical protein
MNVATARAASSFLFQWDDTEQGLWGNTYQDGVLIQSVLVGLETYANGYGLWNNATMLADFRVAVNIWEPGGRGS